MHELIFCHQAMFIRRKTNLRYPYNRNYRIAVDYNSFLSMYINGYTFSYLPMIIADYDMTGISSHCSAKTFREIYQIRLNRRVVEKNFRKDTLFLYGYFRRRIFDDMLPD